MRLTQLRHLVGLAECASFSKAAPALFITQPALSRSIRSLEDELGFPLFDRVGRRIELTPFGKAILERARRLLEDAKDIGAMGVNLRNGLSGRLRVGLGSGPGAFLTQPLLLDIAARRRSIHLEIARGTTDLLLQRLRARTLDALVVDILSVTPAADLRIDVSCEMRGAFLCRGKHSLARRKRVAFEDLLNYPIASTPLSEDIARLLMQRYGPAAHPDELVTLRGEELPSLVDVASHSDAILLAVRAVAPELHELRLDPPLGASAHFGLITLAGRAELPSTQILRRAMQQHLHD